MWWRRRRSCNAPRVKTDAKDALHLARLLRLGEITPIAVPSLEQEAARIGCCLLALCARRTMLHVWLAASRVGDSVLVVRLLGPVQVVKAGEQVAPGGPRQRAVLALLLLDAGRLVPAERLVEGVWRGKAPPGAVKTLRSYVSRLRSLLAPEANLVARGGGYVMTLDAGRVDIAEFEEQLAAGQAALSAGDRVTAASRFQEALGLWRGPALADVREVEQLALEARRLDELRLLALEGRIEADVELGKHAEVIGELEGLLAEYPLRERLWRLLVLALYRCERQADALEAYRRVREMFVTELGLEPGEELRALERAVLRHEVPVRPPPRRHNLPAPLNSFVGRDRELTAIDRLLRRGRLITLTGVGGAGKTRLALEAATAALDNFPDGVWLAELARINEASLVPSLVMEALGVRQTRELPVVEAMLFRLRSAESLLVLDNCEHLLDASAELAEVLLRGSPGLRVLATSREPLGLPGEVIYVVQPLGVPPQHADAQATAQAPAVRLFLDRVSAARGGSAESLAPAPVAGRICRKLDGLPLAIELAAARIATLSAAEIEAHLGDRFRFLANRRRPAADPRHQALQATIDWSYNLLTEEERLFFSELSVFAGSFGLSEIAAVCAAGDEQAALELTDRLASKSLVVAEANQAETRYRQLETIRAYAADRLAVTGRAEAARRRHLLAFLNLAAREREMAVLSRELDNFRAALESAMLAADDTGPQLVHALGDFWQSRGLLAEGRNWLERALTRTNGDRRLRAGLLRLLGAILHESGDLERAEAVLTEGAQAADAADSATLQARIEVLLAETCVSRGANPGEMLRKCELAAATLDSAADLDGLAEAYTLAGRLRFSLGYPAVEESLERAIVCARQSGHHRAQMRASHWLAVTFHVLPIPVDQAIADTEQFLEDATGDPWAEADLLKPLSVLYAYVGRADDARAAVGRSRTIFAKIGARLALAEGTIPAGMVELVLGNAAGAERYWREGQEECRAMGERGYDSDLAAYLAQALYAQGRFDEAERMAEQAEAVARSGRHMMSRTTKAKLVARSGNFGIALNLISEIEQDLTPGTPAADVAELLLAKAEVNRLAGAPGVARASLLAAQRIYKSRRATALVDRTRAALASLDDHGHEPT